MISERAGMVTIRYIVYRHVFDAKQDRSGPEFPEFEDRVAMFAELGLIREKYHV